ncbi:hypothetical protein BJX65DRAFT_285648 [Aspergillus insuetus]
MRCRCTSSPAPLSTASRLQARPCPSTTHRQKGLELPSCPARQCEATELLRASLSRCFDPRRSPSLSLSSSLCPAYLPSEKLYSSSHSCFAASSGPHVSRKCTNPFFILLNRVGCVAQVVGWAALAELRSVVGMFPDIVGGLRCRWVWRGKLGELLGVLVEGFEVDEMRAGGQRLREDACVV